MESVKSVQMHESYLGSMGIGINTRPPIRVDEYGESGRVGCPEQRVQRMNMFYFGLHFDEITYKNYPLAMNCVSLMRV
jgi:hypothetical protein